MDLPKLYAMTVAQYLRREGCLLKNKTKKRCFVLALVGMAALLMNVIAISLSPRDLDVLREQIAAAIADEVQAGDAINRGNSAFTGDILSVAKLFRRKRRQLDKTTENRPVMHTFYHRVDKGTGMTEESDVRLLLAWATAWHDAGWAPRILTMRDVRRHTDYERRRNFLEESLWGEYNTMCFWRWFAMATVESGGWMSDYDVFPLNSFLDRTGDNLPNAGNLTVHQQFVPALVSGSQSEWARMANVIVDNAAEHRGEDLWSDMHALQDMWNRQRELGEERHFYDATSVMLAHGLFKAMPLKEKVCARLRRLDAIAVHFSHSSLKWAAQQIGFLTKKDADNVIEQRPEICEEYIGKWRRKCLVGSQEGMSMLVQ